MEREANDSSTECESPAPPSSSDRLWALNRERKRSKYTWCLTSTETVRLIGDGEKGGGESMEVWEDGYYISIVTLSPPE